MSLQDAIEAKRVATRQPIRPPWEDQSISHIAFQERESQEEPARHCYGAWPAWSTLMWILLDRTSSLTVVSPIAILSGSDPLDHFLRSRLWLAPDDATSGSTLMKSIFLCRIATPPADGPYTGYRIHWDNEVGLLDHFDNSLVALDNDLQGATRNPFLLRMLDPQRPVGSIPTFICE